MTTGDSESIRSDPDILGGEPVFVGSRLPVRTLPACVDAGNNWDRIVASWPWLTRAHVDAARHWEQTHPLASDGAPTAYVGISGVLHPSESVYELLRSRSPWTDGHSKYEGVPVLEAALQRWPDVRIVLTSTQPWAHGLESVLEQLGPALAERVDGYTYDDLTNKAKRRVVTRSGTTRSIAFSSEDYWRMNKSQIVAAHVEWRRPSQWIAIDDEDILWPHDMRRDKLVLTDGCEGLLEPRAQDRLMTLLVSNFGPPSATQMV